MESSHTYTLSIWCRNKALKTKLLITAVISSAVVCRLTTSAHTSASLPSMTSSCWNHPPLWSHSLMTVLYFCVMFKEFISYLSISIFLSHVFVLAGICNFVEQTQTYCFCVRMLDICFTHHWIVWLYTTDTHVRAPTFFCLICLHISSPHSIKVIFWPNCDV